MATRRGHSGVRDEGGCGGASGRPDVERTGIGVRCSPIQIARQKKRAPTALAEAFATRRGTADAEPRSGPGGRLQADRTAEARAGPVEAKTRAGRALIAVQRSTLGVGGRPGDHVTVSTCTGKPAAPGTFRHRRRDEKN